jgi:signal transduction histidine kinase
VSTREDGRAPLSLRVKIGLLVGAAVAVSLLVSSLATWLGVPPILVVPATILSAVAVTQVLAHRLTSPLAEVTAAARLMGRGDYTQRVAASSHDELGELATAFNLMASELEQHDRQRREVVAGVSDELRTPVLALRSLLEELVDGVRRPDPARLATALAQTESLGRLVSDMIELSRIDAGTVALEPTKLAVRPFLRDVVAEARLAERPVRYVVEVDPFDLVVSGDRARLHQLLGSLLDNAGRHSPVNGTVRVAAYRGRGSLVLEVGDQGPAERTEDGEGSLGWAVARWVADLHGGSLELVDRPRGCLVRAALPLGESPES